MGLVKKDSKEAEKEAEAPEDPPVVKQLKEVDDKYLEIEKEYQREVQKLAVKFTELQQPLLEERKKVLIASEDDGPKTGTPALSGFWLKAMQNHPAFEDIIQEWDEPVLEYLQDIEKSNVDDADSDKGFKLVFRFAANPYFTNTELKKEYKTEEANPYCGEMAVKEIKCDTIEWQSGKDVTVEKVAKKVKGGGAKKAKQKKEKEEARPSFFRDFFRNLSPDTELPEDAKDQARAMAEEEDDEEDDDDDDEALIEYLMDGDHEIGMALRDNIIPFAVRWYTGEAAPEMDDDDEDDDDDDDDDDDEDSDDEPPARGKGKGKGGAAKKNKSTPKSSPEMKPGEAPKEECKQQ